MNQAEFYFEHFKNYKAEGLADYRAGSMTDARFRERLEQTLREARAAGMDVKIWGDPVAQ